MIRTLVKNISGIFFSAVPVKLLIRLTGQNIILPFYHAVSDESLPHLRHLYSIRSVKNFTEDIDFFLKHYQPVSFSDLLELVKGTGKTSKPLVALSFDDGLREVYDVIAPVLLKKGIPAAIFINTAFAGNRGLFFKYKASLIIDRLNKASHPENIYEIINSRMGTQINRKSEMIRKILDIRYEQQNILDSIAELLDIDFNTFLKIRKPYMTIEQLHELQTKGFQIGSHSIDHPVYSSPGLKEQLRQTIESMKWIIETFNPGHRFFSFPFIDDGVTASFFEKIFKKDNRIIDLSVGSSGMKKEKFPFHLQRIPMEKSTLGARFYLRGEYVYYMFKSLFGRDVIIRA
jgi:peptidoglycan/xylan/chitin deacetylase (PgdA/CDA1 family)